MRTTWELLRLIFALSLLAVGGLAWPGSAKAQSIQPVYSFQLGPQIPEGNFVLGPDGNLYGTSVYGGSSGNGTVFKMTTNGVFTVLYSFSPEGFDEDTGQYTNSDGVGPHTGLALGPDGNFYGTTQEGGIDNSGTVFQVTTNGALTTLVGFSGTNGALPAAGLTLGPDGNFYGTTGGGGSSGNGTVFRVTTTGTLNILHSFTTLGLSGSGSYSSNYDGASPEAGLTLGSDGNIYGTTYIGGTNGYGTMFKVATNGTLTTLAAFTAAIGENPSSSLTLGPDGNFYGITGSSTAYKATTNGVLTFLADFGNALDLSGLTLGPDGNFYCTAGVDGPNGGIFRIGTNGTVSTVLTFAVTNGVQPSGLTLVDGNLYGVTVNGGITANGSNPGEGTAFEVTTNGTLTTLADFPGSQGAFPYAGLTAMSDGNFYGTTYRGGIYDDGTVFQLTTNGVLTTPVSFAGTNGAAPEAGLTPGPDGNLYGTASAGGSSGNGTLFEITTSGAFRTLATFADPNGANPYAGLTLGLDGNFYGTTFAGPADGDGTIFVVTTNGTLTTFFSFNGNDGAYPNGLTLGPDGNFYGTTYNNYADNGGTVFRVTTNRDFTTLVNFDGNNGDYLYTGLTLGPDGNLYGTCFQGGNNYCGTVFQVTTSGAVTTLHFFSETTGNSVGVLTNSDGQQPYASLALGPDGDLYGTTQYGGGGGNGTVFKITTNGVFTALASFAGSGADGTIPYANLTLGPDGNFYGATSAGGIGGGGVIFRLNLPPEIIQQPSAQMVVSGTNASFGFSLFGTGPFGYQWYSNGIPVIGGTNNTLVISNVTASSLGNFQAIVTGAWGSVTSSVAGLTIMSRPNIAVQPQSLIVNNGSPADFTISAAGTAPLSYQWQLNGTNLTDGGAFSGSATSNLVVNPANTNDFGNYRVIVTNDYGSITSSVAKLTVVLSTIQYTIVDLTPAGPGETGADAFALNNNGQVAGEIYLSGGGADAFIYSGGKMTDLGSFLSGNDSYALAINSSGQVAGTFESGNNTESFLYSGGLITILPFLENGSYVQVIAINDNGRIVGQAEIGGGSDDSFLYSGGTMTDLGLGGPDSIAEAINDSGQIVGWFETPLGDEHAYLDYNGMITDLGTLGGANSEAYAINPSGEVVGAAQISDGTYHPFLSNGGPMTDLGTLEGANAFAEAINDSGQIIGYTYDGYWHSFIYSGGKMTDLGTLGGDVCEALAINNSGQIVGKCLTSSEVYHAFLYNAGTMTDLNNLINTNSIGTILFEAVLINDSGQIVAEGNNEHAYLLTPGLSSTDIAPTLKTASTVKGIFSFSWNPLVAYPQPGYQVQFTTNLLSGIWLNLGGIMTNGNFSLTNSGGSSREGFYRVELAQ